jgi:UDPglucose 6-dehydrogenase
MTLIIYLYEPGFFGEVVAEARGRNLFFSTEVEKAIDASSRFYFSQYAY